MNDSLKLIRQRMSSAEELEKTIEYLAARLSFLQSREQVLICLPGSEPQSIGRLMQEAVSRCSAVPIMWEGDLRWKSLLRLAFSSRATTIIGPPLVVLGLSKLAKAQAIPLYIRNVVTAGYPCTDWMIDGIIKGLDCDTWGCYEPGSSAVVSGFSCGKSRGVHLRDDVYGVDIVDEQGHSVPEGQIGQIVLYAKVEPEARYMTSDFGRWDSSACACGCSSPRLMDIHAGKYRAMKKELAELVEYLHQWTSILDCRVEQGQYGLELELTTFPGEKLPQLPSCAKRVIRPWNPEEDMPMEFKTIAEKSLDS